MVNACIKDKNLPYGLHRLGITMHVYADTWAHQGFAGINDKINEVHGVKDEHGNHDPGIMDRLNDFWDNTKSTLVSEAMPLGHGAALSYPDRPFLKWHYTNGEDQEVVRNNPQDFMEAAHHMCMAMQRYQQGNVDASVPGLSEEGRSKIEAMLLKTTDEDGEKRHKVWLAAIADGEFDFPAVKLEYIAKGKHSWKHQAIGDTRSKQLKNKEFPYHSSFLDSDWKMFHDALLAHRFVVVHNILPKYGICAA